VSTPTLSPAPRRGSIRPAPVARLLVGLALIALLAGCQVKVAVDTTVNKDGSGTVSVGIGFDDKALTRVGDPNTDIKTDDLKAAGWTVAPAVKGPDGFTWLRASKAFANPDELTRVLAEVSGSSGLLRDYTFVRTETDSEITYTLTGTVDTSKGLAAFADPELAAKLGGDPFGGNIAVIEAEEGKPVSDMVSFDVTAKVADGAAKSYQPTLADKAVTSVDVATVEQKPPPLLQSLGIIVLIGLGVVVVVVGLVAARRRFQA
jgi:hypothetical protein